MDLQSTGWRNRLIMRIVQVVSGKFHHFHLARYLRDVDALERIYTGYPWSKLKNEGLDRSKVWTYPWFQAAYMGISRYRLWPSSSIKMAVEWWAHEALDKYASRTLPECDVVVGLSGSGLRTGELVKSRGGKFVCDRGSSHIRYQNEILREEFEIWSEEWNGIDPRVIAKEEREYEQADVISVPSEFVYQSFRQMGIDADKLRKVPYGANVSRFKQLGTPERDKFIVLFVGQMSLRKGLPYLLKAFADFQHPRKELWLVGSVQPETERILKKFPNKGIKLVGAIANNELALIYSKANVFVLPSIEEGLALVQGEALACGCPVIASENTGASDLFDHEKEGFIVPIRSHRAISDRLQQLADDEVLRQKMSCLAIERVRKICGWATYGKKYYSMLKLLTTQ